MARRTLINIDEKIIQAVIQIGSKEGIKNITSKKVAQLCDISHFTCFEHFGTKQKMLEEAALYIENKYLIQIQSLFKTNKTIEEIWDYLLEILINKPHESMYYYNFHKEIKCDIAINNNRILNFLNISKEIFIDSNATTDIEFILLWNHIIELAFYYSEKFINELIPNTIENKKYIKKLIFNGIKK